MVHPSPRETYSLPPAIACITYFDALFNMSSRIASSDAPDPDRLLEIAERPVVDTLALIPEHIAFSSREMHWPGLLVWHQRAAGGALYVPPTSCHVLVLKLDKPNMSTQLRTLAGSKTPEEIRREQRYWARGATAVVPAGEASYWSNESGRDNLLVHIDPSLLLKSATALAPQEAASLQLKASCAAEDERLRLIGMTLLETLRQPEAVDLLFIDCMAQALAAHLVANHSIMTPQRDGAAAFDGAVLKRIDDYIDAHLAESIRLADLAAEVGLSEAHFSRRFRRAVGISPYQHVLACRMQRAMGLLSGAHRSVLDVALDVGFQDAAHFSRSFRQHVGVSPLAWRKGRV